MDIRKVTPTLSVCGQLQPDDVGAAAAQGFRTIIINRPDGESGDQPSHMALAEEAARHGVETRFVPVVASSISESDVAAFAEALNEAPSPALAFCRSGQRSTMLWALTQAGQMPGEQIVETAADAGYDISGMRRRLG